MSKQDAMKLLAAAESVLKARYQPMVKMFSSLDELDQAVKKAKKPMRDLEGVCPKCFEHTTAGESCCGFGAIVEGAVMSDETAQQLLDEENDTESW